MALEDWKRFEKEEGEQIERELEPGRKGAAIGMALGLATDLAMLSRPSGKRTFGSGIIFGTLLGLIGGQIYGSISNK
jgi:hypothetical protein